MNGDLMSEDDPTVSGEGDQPFGRQMDPRPLDDLTTTTQESAYSYDPAIVQSQRIHRLYAYWLDKAAGGVPARAEFDPVDVRELLPNLMMLDVLGEPLRLR